MNMKHNKIKNTGILFEILCNKMTYETLNPTTPQCAAKILKKHFKKGTLLSEELKLYHQLYWPQQGIDGNELVGLVVENRQRFDTDKLNREKFGLVKSIKQHYDVKEFFDSRVKDYKLLAAIFGVMEGQKVNPTEYLKHKSVILESIAPKPKDTPEPELLQEDPDVLKLTFKIIVEKFNETYKNLLPDQKVLLSKFINSDHTTTEFKDFVISECKRVKNKLSKKVTTLDESVLKIKLNETVGLLDMIMTAKGIVKEDHISALLKYYELIEEIK